MNTQKRRAPLRRLLIANRGEIACRIIRSAQRLGLKAIAVSRNLDQQDLHCRRADAVALLGDDPACYLDAAALLAAAQAHGADCIHPGFGFLAENADFARQVAKAGLTFIGPPAQTIALMGDKLAALAFAKRCAVETLSGDATHCASLQEAKDTAQRLGFPLMLKAAGGGGGKSMHRLECLQELEHIWPQARAEAQSAFADDRLYLERWLENPRHIEVQLLADHHGRVLTLGERDCSLQRRFQKVIEEAPAPALSEDERRALSEKSIALARAADYHSAGTVEFLRDRSGRFFFIEMNTRIQVEHTVSEMISGIDIVAAMIKIADGWALPASAPPLSGHAIQARLYAEDPWREFLPCGGTLRRLALPPHRTIAAVQPAPAPSVGAAPESNPWQEVALHLTPSSGIQDGIQDHAPRIDSGVCSGDSVSLHYDPMLAKIIAHAPTRAQACAGLITSLETLIVDGITHNAGFLIQALRAPAFSAAELSTAFFTPESGNRFAERPPPDQEPRLAALLAASIFEAEMSLHPEGPCEPQDLVLALMDAADARPRKTIPCQITQKSPQHLEVALENTTFLLEKRPGDEHGQGQSPYRLHRALHSKGRSNDTHSQDLWAQVTPDWPRTSITHAGFTLKGLLVPKRTAELWRQLPAPEKDPQDYSLKAPMPCRLAQLAVTPGDLRPKGALLAVVEAMKMLNRLCAAQDLEVTAIKAASGDILSSGQVILEFRPQETPGDQETPGETPGKTAREQETPGKTAREQETPGE